VRVLKPPHRWHYPCYLSRTNRTHLVRFVWGGVAAAVALSLAVAVALERFNISEDGFEGLLLLVAAFFVVTMISG